MPWRRARQPTHYPCLENPHGQRSLAGCGPGAPDPSEATPHACFISYSQTLATINLLSIWMDVPVLDTSYKRDHKMWHLVTDFCHLAQHFQCPAILQPALVFHAFYC